MNTSYKDYYATLGVPRTATAKEIRSAFRRLARRYHPDVNKDPDAVARFKEINEANEVLSDPGKRGRYDELGPGVDQWQPATSAGTAAANPFAGPAGGQVEYQTVSPEQLEEMFGGANPFSEFFHSMFGRSGAGSSRTATRGRSAPAAAALRGVDVEGEVTISLEEAYRGVTRTVELSGAGTTRRVEVKIPAGITDGARVRAAGQGSRGQGGAASGDLLIRVRIAPHPLFTREGQNVRVTVAVPLHVALLGGEIEVPTPKGTRATLSVRAETQNGSRMRLRGLGMPHLRGEARGDLIAELDVRLPLPLTPEQKRAAEAFRP